MFIKAVDKVVILEIQSYFWEIGLIIMTLIKKIAMQPLLRMKLNICLDKNQDNYLDQYELDTLFLADVSNMWCLQAH